MLLLENMRHSREWLAGAEWQEEQRGRPQVGQETGVVRVSLEQQETQTKTEDSRGPVTRAGSERTTSPCWRLLAVLTLLPAPTPLSPTTSMASVHTDWAAAQAE